MLLCVKYELKVRKILYVLLSLNKPSVAHTTTNYFFVHMCNTRSVSQTDIILLIYHTPLPF
jgi:hypothetical protein